MYSQMSLTESQSFWMSTLIRSMMPQGYGSGCGRASLAALRPTRMTFARRDEARLPGGPLEIRNDWWITHYQRC